MRPNKFRRYLVTIAIAYLLSIPTYADDQLVKLYQDLDGSIVKIHTGMKITASGMTTYIMGSGTGFIISKNPLWIATAAHMIEDKTTKYTNEIYYRADDIQVEYPGFAQWVPCDIIDSSINLYYQDTTNKYVPFSFDMAIIQPKGIVNGFNPKPLQIDRSTTVKAGDDVVFVGFSLGGGSLDIPGIELHKPMIPLITPAIIAGTEDGPFPNIPFRKIYLNIRAEHGDSGAPVIELNTHKVIGVISHSDIINGEVGKTVVWPMDIIFESIKKSNSSTNKSEWEINEENYAYLRSEYPGPPDTLIRDFNSTVPNAQDTTSITIIFPRYKKLNIKPTIIGKTSDGKNKIDLYIEFFSTKYNPSNQSTETTLFDITSTSVIENQEFVCPHKSLDKGFSYNIEGKVTIENDNETNEPKINFYLKTSTW